MLPGISEFRRIRRQPSCGNVCEQLSVALQAQTPLEDETHERNFREYEHAHKKRAGVLTRELELLQVARTAVSKSPASRASTRRVQ